MSKIFRGTMAVLGVMEFGNAIMGVVAPGELLKTQLFIGGDLPASDDSHAVRNLMRTYAWALIGLGSIRLAAAAEPSSKPVYLLNLFMHVFEAFFWWAEALEPNTSQALYQVQNYTPDPEKGAVANVLSSLATPFSSGGSDIPSDPLPTILLLGLPLIIATILLHAPSASKTAAKGKKKRS
ncbi:hypothetical protein TeGR_g9630 [Tetraparma gracilis]|uniref:Uncharacterized protein n=1 Tax=Tetraparma gracilis TaxID=2962635 RepID=A0ABQ6MK24_9STRA|nr:hypothetical protein TeGR_g9630 [Tetraparma gracilis]